MLLERKLLKSIIEQEDISTLLDANIRVDMFVEEKRHKYAFEFIVDSFRKNGTFPTIAQIKEKFDLDLDLIQLSFTLDDYINQLKQRYLMNRVDTDILPSIQTYIKKDHIEPIKEILRNFLSEIEDLTNNEGIYTTLKEGIDKRLDEYFEKRDRRTIEIGFPLPWQILTEATFGIMKGEMWVIAAKQNIGKTFLTVMLANHIWQAGHNVLFISMEDPVDKIKMRWDATCAKIPYKGIRGGQLTIEEENTYIETLEFISQKENIAYIVGDGKVKSPYDIEMIIKDHQDIDIVFIDGIYLLSLSDNHRDAYLEASAIAKIIQKMALRTQVPFFCSTQFQRKGMDEDGIAYSQDIIRCANVVLGLYNDKDLDLDDRRFIKTLKLRDSKYKYFLINFNPDEMNFDFIQETDEKMNNISTEQVTINKRDIKDYYK